MPLFVCCRLGPHGVQSCVADPGAVRTSIFSPNPKLNHGLPHAVISSCYAPPDDGAAAIIHAATCDWEADGRRCRCSGRGGDGDALWKGAVAQEEDLRYYTRGFFAWPVVRGVLWGFHRLLKP